MNALKYAILLLLPILISAQTNIEDNIAVHKYELGCSNYKDFALSGQIYAVTKHDSLVVWDIENHKTISVTQGISAIGKSNSGDFHLVTTDGKVKISGDGISWRDNGSVTGKPYYLLIDKNNIHVIITSDGFYYDSKYYPAPNESPFYYNSNHRCSAFMRKPDVAFLDSSQRIWMAFNDGEFGGSGYFFDLNKKEFYPEENFYSLYEERYPKKRFKSFKIPYKKLKKEFPNDIVIKDNDTLYRFPKDVTLLGNTRGITEDSEGNFYTAYSLMHFFLQGSIYKTAKSSIENFYKGVEIDILDKEDYWSDSGGKMRNIGFIDEYLGPVQYSPFDKHIYFYTNNGFFRLIENGSVYSKEFVFKPYIT